LVQRNPRKKKRRGIGGWSLSSGKMHETESEKNAKEDENREKGEKR